MALYVFTYVFILSQTSCIWYIFLDGFFFCTIASSSPGMAINGPQMGNGGKCRNIYTCHFRKGTFHKYPTLFLKRPIHETLQIHRFGLTMI